MSQENVDAVIEANDAFMRRDAEAARAAYDPHAVMILPVIGSQVLYGISEIERGVGRWRESWDEFEFRIEETIASGDQVVAISRQRGVGKDTGAPVELVNYGVYTLRNRKIIRLEYFDSRREALEAAGMSDSAPKG